MFSASPVRASLLTRVSCARVDGTAMGRLRTGNSLEAVASMSRSDTTSTSIWQAPMPSSLRKTLNKKVNHYPLTMSACERGMQGLREAAGAAAIGAAGDAAARHQSPVPRRSQTILDVIDWTLIKGSWDSIQTSGPPVMLRPDGGHVGRDLRLGVRLARQDSDVVGQRYDGFPGAAQPLQHVLPAGGRDDEHGDGGGGARLLASHHRLHLEPAG